MDWKKLVAKPYQHQGHKLRTRRDLFAHGVYSMAGWVMAPSIFTLMSSRVAYGQECDEAGGAAGNAGFLVFDLAGGGNISGSNVMVGGLGGQEDFLGDYSSLGLPAGMHPRNQGQVNTEFGLMFHSDSGFLRGLLETTTEQTRAQTDGFITATSNADDTGNNPLNPMYWIYSAGARGSLVPLVGTDNSVSGGRSLAPAGSVNPSARPVPINRPEDSFGLANVGMLTDFVTKEQAEKVMKTISNLSEKRLAKFQAQDLPTQLRTLAECGYVKAGRFISENDATSLDPRNDTDVTSIFTNMNDGNERKTASIAKLVIEGQAGAGTIVKGGHDYHDGSRATGEARDIETGRLIGQSLQLAATKGKALMIYVFTDGGVVSSGALDNSDGGRGKGVWQGDSGQRSAQFVMAYHPDGKVKIRSEGRQIGAYKDNGAVDNAAARTSSNPVALSRAITLNYLAMHGNEGQLAQLTGENPFGAETDDYIIISKPEGA